MRSIRRRVGVAAAVAVAMVASACSGGPASDPGSEPPPPPEPEISFEPEADAPPTGPEPPVATSDPHETLATESGPLTAKTLPREIGAYTGDTDASRQMGVANGSWVAETEGPVASFEALPQCGAPEDAAEAVSAEHALTGAYRSPEGNLGIGVVMEFADADSAAQWFTLFGDRLAQCEGDTTVRDLDAGPEQATYHRDMAGQIYSEAGVVSDKRVLLIALGEELDPAPLADAARSTIDR